MKNCPCCSGKTFAECCGIYISGQKSAPTAEALMRSRYAAYATANIDYIARTMRGRASVNFDKKNAESWAKQATWLGLKIIEFKQQDNQGWVEFKAYYSENQESHELHELSKFEYLDGQWFYTDGKTPA
jgi:SEC-C motif-containing protein